MPKDWFVIVLPDDPGPSRTENAVVVSCFVDCRLVGKLVLRYVVVSDTRLPLRNEATVPESNSHKPRQAKDVAMWSCALVLMHQVRDRCDRCL